MSSRSRMPSAFLVSGALSVLSIWLLLSARGDGETYLLPRILLACILVCSLIVCVRELRIPKSYPPFGAMRFWLMLLILSALGIGISFWGFLVPTIVATLAILWLYGQRSWLACSLGTLCIAVIPWLLFQYVLGIQLPTLLPGGPI